MQGNKKGMGEQRGPQRVQMDVSRHIWDHLEATGDSLGALWWPRQAMAEQCRHSLFNVTIIKIKEKCRIQKIYQFHETLLRVTSILIDKKTGNSAAHHPRGIRPSPPGPLLHRQNPSQQAVWGITRQAALL